MPRRKKQNKTTTTPFKRQLGVKAEEKISGTLLNRIIRTKEGSTLINPSKIGHRRIKVTNLLIRRAILTKNLRKLKGRRR